MPAAPKTPNLMASLDVSTLGGLKASQRRLTRDPISSKRLFRRCTQTTKVNKGYMYIYCTDECADGKCRILLFSSSPSFRLRIGRKAAVSVYVSQRNERKKIKCGDLPCE